MGERRAALGENLLSVRDEQQPRPGKPRSESSVVHSSHHRLAGTGRRDKQVAVVALCRESSICSRSRSWNGSSLISTGLRDTCQGFSTRVARGQEAGLLVLLEVSLLPVALENGGNLVDHGPVSGSRHADIPFQAADLRGVGQVR